MPVQNELLQVSIRVCIDLCAMLLGLLMKSKQLVQAHMVHLGFEKLLPMCT